MANDSGGRFSVEYDLDAIAEGVRVGDLILPERFTARLGSPDDHTVEIDVVVEDGAPVVDAIRVLRDPRRPSLRGAELRGVPVDDLIAMAAAHVAMRSAPAGRGVRLAPVPSSEHDEITTRFRRERRRNAITDEHLREVAAVWRQGAQTGAPARAVQERWRIPERTAARWIKLARERGFLEPKGAKL